MKILYIHQYFSTPETTVGSRSYYISRELVRRGHEVVMLTMEDEARFRVKRTIVDGIRVIYMKGSYHQSMGIARRVLSFISFMVKSTFLALRVKNVDLVISTSTPLTVGFPALILKKFKGIPFIFEVRDLWPEVPIQMGGLKGKPMIRLVEWFEKAIYRNAVHIVALSPGMLEGVARRGIPVDKISMIPNMAKLEVFGHVEKNAALPDTFGLNSNSFKAVYFGSMGLANGMEYIIDAANLLKDHEDIEFVFLGNGAMRPMLKERCRAEGIHNAFFLGFQASRELSQIVSFCDISLVTFSNIPILATNSPQKLFDSLSAGKPVLVNSPGWTKELVETHQCGAFVDPEVPAALAEKILYLKAHPAVCREMGRNARKLAETRYDKTILCSQFGDLVDHLSSQLLSNKSERN